MKVKVTIIFLLSLSVITFIYIYSVLRERPEIPVNNNLEQGIENNIIDEWYLVSESRQHKIYTSGVKGGHIVVVLDKDSSTLLVPNDSCEINIGEDLINDVKNNFYNSSVGINILGPYKSIRYDTARDVFVQTVQNAGCLSEEGSIKLKTNNNSKTVSCDIVIQYKHLGC